MMKAGRELDALIAEKVMGWSALRGIDEISKHFPDTSKIYSPHLAEVWINDAGERMACKECGNMPAYSAQIADAWLVVEKMSTTTKEFWKLKYFSTGAIAIFDYEGGRDLPWIAGEHEGDAEEMPEAICLAALKAVGYEE